PYGAYVQLGPAPTVEEPVVPAVEAEDGKKKKTKKKKVAGPKPKRMSLPKGMDPNLIDLETALKLLALPRDIGAHPETGEMISAGLGRFGPYIKMGTRYKSLEDSDDLLTVGINRAVSLLAEPDKGRRAAGGAAAKTLGEHPGDGKPVTLNSGRFGPYVKWAKVMATVTKGYDPESLTLDQALEIIEAKIAKGPSTKGKAAKAKPAKAKVDTKNKGKPKPKTKTKTNEKVETPPKTKRPTKKPAAKKKVAVNKKK
ncbi:MAG: topoisomerase C-terminal repeat-containing protein, partial [Alphaproteobacteria bacterium]|nr:topoisomerase C-terminal repeat-containing protein [Alphaproteobacteria bacterium]